MIDLLQKIEKYKLITPDDYNKNLLWQLFQDGTRCFFVHPHGTLNKSDWKNFQNSTYRIFPYEFELSCSCENLYHEDCPETLTGDFLLTAKIIPEMGDFASWFISRQCSTITDEDIRSYFQQHKAILQGFIQQNISGESVSDLTRLPGKHLKTDIHADLPDWLSIVKVRTQNNITMELPEFQKKINRFNDFVAREEEKLQYARQQLDFDVSWANLEAARQEISRNRELAEIAHQQQIELLAAEHQAKLFNLEKEKELASVQKESLEIENEIKRCQKDLVREKQEGLKESQQIRMESLQQTLRNKKLAEERILCENQYSQNRLKNQEKEAENASEQHRIQLEISRMKLETATKENLINQEILAEELKIKKLEAQRLERQMAMDEELHQAQVEAYRTGNRLSRQEAETIRSKSEKSMDEIQQQILQSENRKSDIYYKIPSDELVDLIQRQKAVNPVIVTKNAVIKGTEQVACRSIKMEVATARIQIGSNMQFSFRSDRSGCITILCLGSSCLPENGQPGNGNVFVMEPNILDGNRKVEKNREYTLPGTHFLSELQGIAQTGPAGVERILAIVTEKPLLQIPSGLNDFDRLSPERLAKLADTLKHLAPDSWSAGYLAYQVTA